MFVFDSIVFLWYLMVGDLVGLLVVFTLVVCGWLCYLGCGCFVFDAGWLLWVYVCLFVFVTGCCFFWLILFWVFYVFVLIVVCFLGFRLLWVLFG